MPILTKLSALALRHVSDRALEHFGLGFAAKGVVAGGRWVAERYTPHQRTLADALSESLADALDTLAFSLGGDSVIGRVWALTRRADERGFRAAIHDFLDAHLPRVSGELAGRGVATDPADFRRRALAELRRARAGGGPLDEGAAAADLDGLSDGLRAFAGSPDDEAVRAAVDAVGADLPAAAYPHLALLLRFRPDGGGPILVAAFEYHFRRRVRADAGLRDQVTFDRLQQLARGQAEWFGAISDALAEHGAEMRDLLAGLVANVDGLRAEVGDGRAEQAAGFDRVSRALAKLDVKLDRLTAEAGLTATSRGAAGSSAVRQVDGGSIGNGPLRAAVRQAWAEFSALPESDRRAAPDRARQLGVLLHAAGMYAEAEQAFGIARAAEEAAGHRERAARDADGEYQSALERRAWADALAHWRRAVALDPAGHAPLRLDRYDVDAILGAGGVGVAMACRDRYARGRRVVVKAVDAGSIERSIDDLFAEAHVLSGLSHPAIVRVIDQDFADPARRRRPYLVMEPFDGGVSLRVWLEKHGPLPLADALAVATLAAEGLAAAHAANVLHRDVKPDNLLVRRNADGSWAVQWIDFGLALRRETIQKTVSRAGRAESHRASSGVGTAEYAPPEQMGMGSGKVGPWSDVYSFAKLFCKMAVGRSAPRAQNLAGLPAGLVVLLERSLDEDVAERPQGFGEVLQVLRGSAPAAPPLSPPPAVRSMASDVEWAMSWLLARPTDLRQGRLAEVVNSMGMKFVPIAPGTFLMGTPENEWKRHADETQHRVTLTKGFYLGAHEVTQKQWAAVMGENPSRFKGDDLPVEQVSWNDVQSFIDKLDQLPAERAAGRKYRLPTEAEWEYACRAGTTTPYHTGATIDPSQANYGWDFTCGNEAKSFYREKTTPVGSFKPNGWGLYDMHGNVWEWCQDVYKAEYPAGLETNPAGLPQDPESSRALRGSSWVERPTNCRAGARGSLAPSGRLATVGFRVCLDSG